MRVQDRCSQELFINSFVGFSKKTRKKGDLRMDISALKSVSDFAFDCESEIRSLKSKSRFPNRTHPFNLYRDYSKSLTLSNLSEPPLSWITENHLQVQKEKDNFVVGFFTFSKKREIRHLHVVVVHWHQGL